ncbi:replication restart helicase PriA [Anaerobaca lacustris]|uniref:Replication restart protein PriA n=1 Tax=Anaerobaca lacustris TaxID=3044600 RepID=A0AAW6TW02_9BACT|nr:primosomal protein N' [Sedimentisphaerales bacterium M17dextr]
MTRKHMTPSLFASQEPPEPAGTHVIRVALASAADTEFDYLVPDALWPVEVGRRVEVPFGRGNKPEVGFCVESDVATEKAFHGAGGKARLKRVARVLDDEPLLGPDLMELARWIGEYYVCPLGQVLAAMVPGAVKRAAGVRKQRCVYLTASPEEVAAELRSAKQKQIVNFLSEREAVTVDAAVEVDELVEAVDCRPPVVKRLAEKGIVKLAVRKVLRALPVVPESMANPEREVVLNADQQHGLERIVQQIESARFGVTLLHGVTDSGKTELYIRAIEVVVAKGKAAIVLLPEIALTAQTVQRFNARFARIAVMHSGLTAGQRNVQWQKVRAGETDVVIGARSAIFAPLPNLGIVVVDEEHEPSYKQDTVPRYHGRDVAIKRAQLAGAHCILGSATPSLESLHNSRTKSSFTLVRLPKRVMDLPMPEMKLVDMRAREAVADRLDLLSRPLVQHLTETLARKEQAILLLNRRGYSNFVFCPSCKHTLQCRNCDAALTFHKTPRTTAPMKTVTGRHMDFGYAICHHCLAKTLVPRNCPLCGKAMTMIGLGSQRLEEELAARFPEARVRRVDSDSMASRDYYRLLKEFGQGRIDILAGTQILAKGLHFPNVTLVGVVSADTCLYLPDFRSNERTFQLISQVAGRAGRSEKHGTVFVQTYFPDQPTIQFALKQDFEGFVREEMKHRETCTLPPLWRLATVVMRDETYDRLEAAANKMRLRIDDAVARHGLQVKVRGPMPAVISRIQRFHRLQIVVQAPTPAIMGKLFADLRTAPPIRPAVKIAVDIDPVNLL